MSDCVVCNNKINFKEKFEILKQCKVCDHIFADIKLDENEIKNIYSDKYFFGNEYINYIEDKKQIKKNSLIRLISIKKYLTNFAHKNIYEIGCAYGFFLDTVKKNFDKVSGIDVNQEAINYASKTLNLDVNCGNFLNVESNILEQYNIFCMFDVIEHLQEPNKFIKRINDYSQKDSLLIITTGDIGSFNAKINGKNWRLIHPPSHIHYFSKKTITKLLNNNGFEVLSINHCGYYRNFSFILNKIKFLTKYFGFFIKILKFFKILNLDIYLNLFDIMFIVAKKQD